MNHLIIFKNVDFLVIDKPHGTLTVPSRLGLADSRTCILNQFSEKLWPVHRLDYEVSGLVLFARNASAHALANQWFENRDIIKTYEAWTEAKQPIVLQKFEEWESYLVRGKKRSFEANHGKHSITKALCAKELNFNENKILQWQLYPLTGRPHQLRYELTKHSFPILGDALYGSNIPFRKNSIALRAIRLDFSKISNRLGLPEFIEIEGLKEQSHE